MVTRRRFVRDLGCIALAGPVLGEAALALRALPSAPSPEQMVWLNANENPAGPPPSAIRAVVEGAAATARYHFDEFDGFTRVIARSENLSDEQVIFGVGSSEIIDAAISAFTSASHPMITATATYEIPIELARSMGKAVLQVPLTETWAFPVRRLAEEARQAGGGLIYLCNPNNPTSSLTPSADIDWLVSNLPRNTVLLVDEAYIHFAEPAKVESSIKYVHESKSVVVTRTFSKIYGMAGIRAGFGCARPDLIRAMTPFRTNVIPVLGLRAATAALNESSLLVPARRAEVARRRSELCEWLRQKRLEYIEPHANFVMIDVGRDVRSFGNEMFRRGVAVGRPFPPVEHRLRVTVGTESEMSKFRDVFWRVYNS
jgi:histidinol-phosphate aminotransferase